MSDKLLHKQEELKKKMHRINYQIDVLMAKKQPRDNKEVLNNLLNELEKTRESLTLTSKKVIDKYGKQFKHSAEKSKQCSRGRSRRAKTSFEYNRKNIRASRKG